MFLGVSAIFLGITWVRGNCTPQMQMHRGQAVAWRLSNYFDEVQAEARLRAEIGEER